MAKSTSSRDKILHGYIEYLSEKSEKPSIYSLSKYLSIDEKEFYNHFSTLDQIDLEIWNDYLKETLFKLSKEKVYEEYSGREKLLAFYYTFIELLKENRSYVVFTVKKNRLFGPLSPPLKEAREHFNDFVKEIISQSVNSGEVEDRKMLTDKYYLGFWIQFVFVLDFWATDESVKFEKTDAAIEKAVNLSFDILGRNPIDSLFDFGKFMFQSKVMGK